jgi:hypothetical protein
MVIGAATISENRPTAARAARPFWNGRHQNVALFGYGRWESCRKTAVSPVNEEIFAGN